MPENPHFGLIFSNILLILLIKMLKILHKLLMLLILTNGLMEKMLHLNKLHDIFYSPLVDQAK